MNFLKVLRNRVIAFGSMKNKSLEASDASIEDREQRNPIDRATSRLFLIGGCRDFFIKNVRNVFSFPSHSSLD